MDRHHLYIGGRWVDPAGSDRLAVVCPSTEEVVGSVPLAVESDVDAAVDAARRSFDEGVWATLPVGERADLLRAVAKELWPRMDEVATTITTEMGATITMSRQAQAPAAAAIFEYYAGLAEQVPVEEERAGQAGPATVRHQPVGVVAAIAPWNGPLFLAVAKLAPALLAGCSVVLKPAPESPLSAYLLAEALSSAGIPDGVVSIVAADREVGHHLVSNPGVDKVAFTGSTEAGRRIMAACAERMTRVTLELGGKSAAVFLDDVDLAEAIPQFLPAAITNNGEMCSATTRLLVPRHRHDETVDALCGAFGSLPVGDPFDEATVVGPMVSERHRERVEGYLRLGVEEGAAVACGGGRPAHLDRGWFVEPTVFVGVDNTMRIAREEIFGPVVVVIPYDGDDEAIAIANDSPYGLTAALFTADAERAVELSRGLRVGQILVNGFTADTGIPFGGFKQSGIGREGGIEGVRSYLETTSVFDVTGGTSR